jgi:hypothetical protein
MCDVVVAGAGLHRYSVFPDKTSIDLGTVAIQRALDDVGCQWTDIEAVYCGIVRLGMSAGHKLCRHMGTTGLAITNVENASSASNIWRHPPLSVQRRECSFPPLRDKRSYRRIRAMLLASPLREYTYAHIPCTDHTSRTSSS